MLRVCAKFVPHLLTDDQKETPTEISQELLAKANGHRNFLKSIITEVETWVYGSDVETKIGSPQWVVPSIKKKKKKRR